MPRKHYRPFFVRGIRKRYLKIMQGGKEQGGRFGRQFFLRITLSLYVKFAIDDFQIEREMLGMILSFQFSNRFLASLDIVLCLESEVIKLNPGIIDPYLLIVTPILPRIVPPQCH